MRKNLAAGALIGIILLFLSFYGMDFPSVLKSLQSFNAVFLFPLVFISLCVQFLRSYRWGVLLEPMEKIDQLTLFSITSVGFLAILAIPARIGELARPYLVAKRSRITMPSALATVVAERIFDTLAILAFFSAVLFSTDIPQWLARSGYVSAAFTLMAIIVVFPRACRQRLVAWAHKLPGKLSFARHWVDQFSTGMASCSEPARALKVFLLSLLIWGLNALWFYLVARAFGLDLSVAAVITLLVVIIIGIAIPAAPGFIGNWHFACVAGLAIFGVPQSPALSYAIVSHFLGLATTSVLGLLFLPSHNLNLAELSGIERLKGMMKGEQG